MDRHTKLMTLLIGLLITDVEDAAVLPEHRDDGLDRNPKRYNSSELITERLMAEAKNCHLNISVADLSYFFNQIHKVVDHVRT